VVPTRAESAKSIARYWRKMKPLPGEGDEGLVRGLHLRFVENLEQQNRPAGVGLPVTGSVECSFEWRLYLALVGYCGPDLARGRSRPCGVSMNGRKSLLGALSGVRTV